MYAPVSGTVVAINEILEDVPGTVNTGAETDGWFIKLEVSDASEKADLMDSAAYKAHCDSEE